MEALPCGCRHSVPPGNHPLEFYFLLNRSTPLVSACAFGLCIAIAPSRLPTGVIVQQRSIPSSREDWLTRPARVVAIVLAGQTLLRGRAGAERGTFCRHVSRGSHGLFRRPAFSLALADNLYWLAVVTLPAFMFGSDHTEYDGGYLSVNPPGSAAPPLIPRSSLFLSEGRPGNVYPAKRSKSGESVGVALYASHLLVLLGACAARHCGILGGRHP